MTHKLIRWEMYPLDNRCKGVCVGYVIESEFGGCEIALYDPEFELSTPLEGGKTAEKKRKRHGPNQIVNTQQTTEEASQVGMMPNGKCRCLGQSPLDETRRSGRERNEGSVPSGRGEWFRK